MRRLVVARVVAALIVAAAPLMTAATALAAPPCSCAGPGAVTVQPARPPAPGDDLVVEDLGSVRPSARSAATASELVPPHPWAPLGDPGLAELGIGVAALVGAAYASSCSARTQRR